MFEDKVFEHERDKLKHDRFCPTCPARIDGISIGSCYPLDIPHGEPESDEQAWTIILEMYKYAHCPKGYIDFDKVRSEFEELRDSCRVSVAEAHEDTVTP